MGIGVFCFVCLLIFAPWLLVAEITHHTLLLPFLVLMGVLAAAAIHLYRPHENCVGAVNLFGRFSRLVNPNEWIVLLPFVQRVRREASLGFRAVTLDMQDVLTHDNVPVNLTLKVFYQFDLRGVSPELRVNILGLEERLIGDIILANLEDVVRNRTIINLDYTKLSSSIGRLNLSLTINAALAKQIEVLGIRMHPESAVKIVDLQPNQQFKTALCSRSAAVVQGKAALERMEPLLKEMRAHYPNVAWDAVGITLASALTQDGEIPPLVIPQIPFPSNNGGGANGGKSIHRSPVLDTVGNKGL